MGSGMTLRDKPLLSAEISQIRHAAWKAIGPLKPAADPIGWGKRTNAGRALRAYHLVYFSLVELLEFPRSGRGGTIAWSIPVECDGQIASIDHRKMGLGVFSSAEPKDELMAEQIVRIRGEDSWVGIVATEAFFGWAEHVLVQVAILHGKLKTGEEIADLAGVERLEKFKTAPDLAARR
jgi:hypothetical protein